MHVVQSTPFVLMFGVACAAAAAALHQFVFAWALPNQRQFVAFGGLCISVAFMILALAYAGQATTVEGVATFLRLGGVAACAAWACQVWHAIYWARDKPHISDWITLGALVLLAYHSLTSSFGIWHSGLDESMLDRGSPHAIAGTASWGYAAFALVQYAIFIQQIIRGRAVFRAHRREIAWTWIFAWVVVLVAQVHDHLVVAGRLHGRPLAPFVFLIIFLLMSAQQARVVRTYRRESLSSRGKLIEQEDRFRVFFDSSSDALIVRDASDGHMVDANATALKLYGFARDRFLRMSVRDLAAPGPEREREDPMRRIRRCLKVGEETFEWSAKRVDGRVFPVEVNLRRIKLNGRVCVLAAIRDIADRKSLEWQLRQSRRIETMGRFAAGVAHDLNTLLEPIVANADILRAQASRSGSESRRHELEEILLAAERTKTLTKGLLEFARRPDADPTVFNVNTLFGEFSKLLRRVLPPFTKLLVERDPVGGDILADRLQLEQVVMNLVVHARDGLPEGGRILIKTRRLSFDHDPVPVSGCSVGTYVVIEISDNGVGMTEEALEHVFEPLFETRTAGGGVSLGLATAYAIVAQHRGGIRVATALGKGTSFEIFLPIHDPDAPASSSRGNARITPRSR